MKFCWSTLMVKDMQASLQFYTEIVGLAVNRRFQAGPNSEIVFLGDGTTLIELISSDRTEVRAGEDISWGFETESLNATISLLKEKGFDIAGPFQPNPSIKFIYTHDPNGMKIQFVENQ